ncbi:MAG: WXG100 family type VII secretion target [Chloroflexota bacterium]
MTADIIQARYDQLDNIANRFGREAENTTALMQQVQRGVDALRQSGWEGQGATAFLGEMETAVFPVIQRLTEALAEANTATQMLRDIIRTAEEEAARPFHGDGAVGLNGVTHRGLEDAGSGGVEPRADSAPNSTTTAGSTKFPENPRDITKEYWDSLTEEEQKELHNARNRYQANANIPLTKEQMIKDEWDCADNAPAHNLKGASGNVDCRGRGSRAGQQAIYDVHGNLVTSSENVGTYDFAPPPRRSDTFLHPVDSYKKAEEHWKMDVEPWLKWGNSDTDTTTPEERLEALLATPEGRLGYMLFGEKNIGKQQAQSFSSKGQDYAAANPDFLAD